MTISFLRIPSINLLRSLIIGMILLLFAGLATFASAATIEITVKNDLISAKLIDVPLIEVLQRVKQEFGFKAHFQGDLSELITLSFTDFPLEKCLQQLTANHSLSVAFLSITKPPKQNDEKQIAEVWVISRSSISRNLNVPPVAPVLPSSDLINNTAKIKKEAPELANDGGQEAVPLGQLLNDPDAKRSSQRQAIRRLAAVGDTASVLTMAESLGHEEKEVRELLVTGISSVENEESTQVLGQVLQDESDPDIRKIAVRALGQRKDDVVAQALLQEAINDGDEELKRLAEQALTQ